MHNKTDKQKILIKIIKQKRRKIKMSVETLSPSSQLPETPVEVLDAMEVRRAQTIGKPVWERKGLTEAEYVDKKFDQMTKIGSELIDRASGEVASDEVSSETGIKVSAERGAKTIDGTTDTLEITKEGKQGNTITWGIRQNNRMVMPWKVTGRGVYSRGGIKSTRNGQGETWLTDEYGTLSPSRNDTAANVKNAAKLYKQMKGHIQTNQEVATSKPNRILDAE